MALKDKQALTATASALFMTIDVTDALEGSLTFYMGEMPFLAPNTYGSPQVYACLTFGELTKYASVGGVSRESDILVAFDPDAVVSPTNVANKRFSIAYLLQNVNFRESVVGIWQWNELDPEVIQVWRGYWGGLKEYSTIGGVRTATVVLRSAPKASDDYFADVVSRDDATFSKAADEALGLMCGRLYGAASSRIDAALADTNELPPMMLGYGGKGIRAIPIDESISASEPTTKLRFAQNDGVSGWKTFGLGNIGSGTVGNIWIFLPEIGVYAHVDSSSISASSNNGTESSINMLNAPYCRAVIRPSIKGSATSAGLTAALGPMLDDDAANYVLVDNISNNIVAFECPNMVLPGATVEELRIAIDVWRENASGGPFDIGLWDIHASGGATWWGGSGKYQTINSSFGMSTGKRTQFITSGTGTGGASPNNFGVWTSTQAAASGTQSEFNNGRFVTVDGSGNRVPIQIRIGVSGVPLRFMGVALVVKFRYPVEQIGTLYQRRILPGNGGLGEEVFIPIGEEISRPGLKTGVFRSPAGYQGMVVFADGEGQKDDGSGTYTGSAAALIEKVPDVARHIIKAIGGATTNDSAGTLGNFLDARTEEVSGDMKMCAPIGPSEPGSWRKAVAEIQSRLEVQIYEDETTWRIIKNEINPHSSRAYPDNKKISAKRDILDGYVRYGEIDIRNIINNVALNYGHSFGRENALGSYAYEHPLSKYRYGLSRKLPWDEPWITRPDLTADHPAAAKRLAKIKASIAAMPRITPLIVRLTQAWYDLQPNHIVQFDDDMEEHGHILISDRGGRLDYQFAGSHLGLSFNQADSATPTLLAAGGVDRQFYAGGRMQFPYLDLHISVSASHTKVVNAWKWYDGSAWTAHTGVTCSDGGDPDEVFMRTGDIRVSWASPTITSWKKAELTFNADPCGPSYWTRYEATTVLGAATGDEVTRVHSKFANRSFEVLEVKAIKSSEGLPGVEAVLQEVM